MNRRGRPRCFCGQGFLLNRDRRTCSCQPPLTLTPDGQNCGPAGGGGGSGGGGGGFTFPGGQSGNCNVQNVC